jgi:16S rRNA (cytidine1402-2'-O)-methyltransferase
MDFYLKKNRLSSMFSTKFQSLMKRVFFLYLQKKVNKIIPDLKKYFSGRKIVFCREISKIYEEFMRKNVDDLELFNKELKGELTIVISEKKIDKNYSQKLSESDMNLIKKMINKLTIKEITEIISQNKDTSKKEIYSYCLKLKNEI